MSEATECPTCRHVMKPFYSRCPRCEGERNRRKVDALAEVIREIKTDAERPLSSDRKAELVRELRTYDHPDVDGLLNWIDAKREKSGGRR